MRTKTFFSTSRLSVLAFACASTFTFAACSRDDDSSMEEILSEDTTPITFNIPNGQTFFFDYVGNSLVMNDTFAINELHDVEITVDLRQGKHNLLWFTGLDAFDSEDDKKEIIPGVYEYTPRVHFDPNSFSVFTNFPDLPYNKQDVRYCQTEMEIFPFLMPTKQLSFSSLTSTVSIFITDNSPIINKSRNDIPYIGYLEGIPNVKSVGVTTQEYTLGEMNYLFYVNESYNSTLEVSPSRQICPLNGIDNIQLKGVFQNVNGNPVPTTKLPKFSIRRGYTTILRGPLFSGATSDWTVTMEQYED